MSGFFSGLHGNKTEQLPKPIIPPPYLSKPWRRTPIEWGDIKYRDSLKQYAFDVSSTTITGYNILMFATAGAGKTSVINTIQSAFKGRISKEGKTGFAEKIVTLEYRTYPVIDSSRQAIGFRLCDTPGLYSDFTYSDVAFEKLITGNTAEGYKFDTAPSLDGGFNQDNVDTRIHCVCFVFNASTFEEIEPYDLKAFRKYQSILNKTDIAHVIILTHIDVLVPDLKYENVEKVFSSRRVLEVVKKASLKLGKPKNQIFPIKNYADETEPVLNMDILTLYNLKSMLDMCEDGVSASLDRLSILISDRI